MSSQISGKMTNCPLESASSGNDVVDDEEEKDEGDAAPGAIIVVGCEGAPAACEDAPADAVLCVLDATSGANGLEEIRSK